MAKRNQLGSALRRGNPGDSRDFERISFGIFYAPDAGDGCSPHVNEGVG
jgi:hypothetical protein